MSMTMTFEGTPRELRSFLQRARRRVLRPAADVPARRARPEPADAVPAARLEGQPLMKMTQAAYRDILREIAGRPPERGGILLGPAGQSLATHFVLDET